MRSSSSRTGSTGSPFFTVAPKMCRPAFTPVIGKPNTCAALPVSTSALCSRPVGVSASTKFGEADAVRVRVQARGHLVGHGDDLHLALAADHELALAVLRGLDGPQLGQLRARASGSSPKASAMSASAFASSNLPATSSTALSGW